MVATGRKGLTTLSMKQLPANTRPRERLLAEGAGALSNAELLALLFGSGIRGRNALHVAQLLLSRHQSLRSLRASTLAEFCLVPGLGEARYALLQAAWELGRRAVASSLERGVQINSPEEAEACIKEQLRHYEHEVFAALFLDKRHRLLSFERLFYGTIDGSTVHVREVIKRALHHNAAAVIFAHNHPSGVSEPSHADRQITERLTGALDLMNVAVLDHIVVGGDSTCSMAAFGYL